MFPNEGRLFDKYRVTRLCCDGTVVVYEAKKEGESFVRTQTTAGGHKRRQREDANGIVVCEDPNEGEASK